MAQEPITIKPFFVTLDVIGNCIDLQVIFDYIRINYKKEVVVLNANDYIENSGRHSSKGDRSGKIRQDNSTNVARGLKIKIDNDYSKQVDYIVKNFDELHTAPSFKLLPLDVVVAVLEKVPEKTKDSLPFADWLLQYIGQDAEARARLISFIPFGKIDGASVRNILSRVGVNMNSLKDAIIRNIVIGSGPESSGGPTNVIKCPYEHGNQLNGIFSKIKELRGQPASEVLKVTGTSDLHMILDPTWTKAWVSPSIPDMWICFDLDARQPQNKATARYLNVKSFDNFVT